MQTKDEGAVLEAGYNFRRELLHRADSHSGAAPLWHGWAIMDAFIAGAKWQDENSPLRAAIEELRKAYKIGSLDGCYIDQCVRKLLDLIPAQEPTK